MRNGAATRSRVFLATVAFLIFGAVGCESLVAPEVESGNRAVATSDRDDQEAGRDSSGSESQDTWKPHRTNKYWEE
jgi:hypothetical protein